MSKVTNKFLAQMPTLTLKGNNTGGTANPTDLSVSSVQTMLGIVSNSWAVYTPTISGFGTVTSSKGTYKQVGDSLFVKIYFVSGTVAASLASFSLPGGFTLSTDTTNKIPVSNNTSNAGIVCGTYTANSNTSVNFGTWTGSIITAPATSTSLVYAGPSVTDLGNLLIPANGNKISNSTAAFSLSFEVILA